MTATMTATDPQATVVAGPIRIDATTGGASVGDTPLPLTGRQRQLLRALATARGQTVPKERLIDSIYGPEGGPRSRVLEIFVHQLRRKLAEAGGPDAARRLETVWGRGYLLR